MVTASRRPEFSNGESASQMGAGQQLEQSSTNHLATGSIETEGNLFVGG